MHESTFQEAVQNLAIIKEVIERTRESFAGFSSIFIGWGILAIFHSIVTAYMDSNTEAVLAMAQQYPLPIYVYPLILIFLAGLIYFYVARKIPLVGLEKILIQVWMLILVLNMIPPQITILSPAFDTDTILMHINTFPGLLFSLAIALITTALLTEYKHFKYLGIAYICLSLPLAFAPWFNSENALLQLMNFVAMPFTFLYIGFFLKTRRAGGL